MKLFKKLFKKKCKHNFSSPTTNAPMDGGECLNCGKTWIEIIDEQK